MTLEFKYDRVNVWVYKVCDSRSVRVCVYKQVIFNLTAEDKVRNNLHLAKYQNFHLLNKNVPHTIGCLLLHNKIKKIKCCEKLSSLKF